MNKIDKIWWILWGLFCIACLAGYLYTVSVVGSSNFIQIEYEYYFGILALAAVGCLRIPYGKSILWIFVFFQWGSLSMLPESQEILALSECCEGKCKSAIEAGYVKMVGDHWEYIPRKDRK